MDPPLGEGLMPNLRDLIDSGEVGRLAEQHDRPKRYEARMLMGSREVEICLKCGDWDYRSLTDRWLFIYPLAAHFACDAGNPPLPTGMIRQNGRLSRQTPTNNRRACLSKAADSVNPAGWSSMR